VRLGAAAMAVAGLVFAGLPAVTPTAAALDTGGTPREDYSGGGSLPEAWDSPFDNSPYAKPEAHRPSPRKSLQNLAKAGEQAAPEVESWTPTSHAVTMGGHTRTTLYASPTFKRVGAGWQRVNGQVKRSKTGGVRADRTLLPMRFGASGDRVIRLTLPKGEVDITLVGAHLSRPRIKRSGQETSLPFRDVFHDVDLHYRVRGSEVKEEFLIKSPQARRDFTFRIEDRQHLLGDYARTADGGYTFGNEVAEGATMSFAGPVAWPVHGSAASAVSAPGSRSATQRLTRTRSGYQLDLALDDDWAGQQRFPVVLDPSIYYWPGSPYRPLVAAYAPISPTACSGDPCPLREESYDWVYVSRVGTGQGETRAYFHADLSSLSPTVVTSVHLGIGYGYAAVVDGYYPATTLHRVESVLGPGSTGADLVAVEDPTVLAADDGEGCDDPYENPWHYGCAYFDVTQAVQDWLGDGNGDEVAFAFQVDPSATESALPLSDPSECSDRYTDSHSYLPGCYYDAELIVDYDEPLPPPIPVEQTLGCDCRWGQGAGVVNHEGNPVSTASGHKMERMVDLTTTAPGLPVSFARTYNGLDTTDGPFGVGWTHEYRASLTEDPGTGDVTFRDPTGGQLRFLAQPGGTYVGDVGATGTLTTVGGGGWKLTSLTGEVLLFDADGRELSDKDRDGRGVTLSYTGSGSSVKLSGLTDAAGNETTLTYGSSGASTGKIVEVETEDGRTVDYGYTTIAGAAHLISRTDPEGQTTEFDYDSTTGLLTGITDPLEHTRAANTYDPVTGRITEQTDATGNTLTFEWIPDSDPGAPDGTGVETVTDENDDLVAQDAYYGNVLTHHSDGNYDTTDYYYDGDLNVVAVRDPRGYVTTMTYDAAGNLLTKTAPAPVKTTESLDL
jgi:YD repeat-containing protein